MTKPIPLFQTEEAAYLAADRLIAELLSYDPDCCPEAYLHGDYDDSEDYLTVSVSYDAIVDSEIGNRMSISEPVGHVAIECYSDPDEGSIYHGCW